MEKRRTPATADGSMFPQHKHAPWEQRDLSSKTTATQRNKTYGNVRCNQTIRTIRDSFATTMPAFKGQTDRRPSQELSHRATTQIQMQAWNSRAHCRCRPRADIQKRGRRP